MKNDLLGISGIIKNFHGQNDLPLLQYQLKKYILPKKFYQRKPETVARELLGSVLIRFQPNGGILAGQIVETEAYLGANDAASHSYRGMNKRNKSMFEEGGILYVYRIYGIHYCINAVTETQGIGSAVLLRAAEPILGIEEMSMRRGGIRKENDICRGPGNLARAFGITDELDGISLCTSDLFIAKLRSDPPAMSVSPRIGISKSTDLPLRFFTTLSTCISGKVPRK